MATDPSADQTNTTLNQQNSTLEVEQVIITGTVKKCSDNCNFSDVDIKAEYNGQELVKTKTGSDGTYLLNFYSNMKNFIIYASYTGHETQNSLVTVQKDPETLINYGTANFKLGIDDVYVSINGNDTTGDGTQFNPYRTIQKGINEVNTSGTVHIIDDGEFPSTDGILTINRSMILKGETGTNGTQPKINFPTTSTWCITITASNVTLDNLYLYQAGNPYEGIICVPKGGSYPNYEIVYSDISITNCVVEWGRRAFYGSVENLTVENCTFKDQYRDSLFLDGMKGTVNIKNNNFIGIVRSANKAIIIESGSGQPYASGDLNIEYNTQIGKAQFFLFNHWDATDQKINLHINHNSIDQTTSKPIVFYCPPQNGFEKFSSILIENNLISNSTPLNTRLAVMIDYTGGALGVAADGQIVIKNCLCWNMMSNTDPTLNFGWENGDPSGVSMNMFSLSGNLVGDPLYEDSNHTDNNFALQSGSPAIGSATDGKNIGVWQSAALEVTDIDPANGATDVPLDKVIIITFNDSILAGSNFNNISVVRSDGVGKYITPTIVNGNQLVLNIAYNWIAGYTYTINLPAGSITSTSGTPIDSYTSTFTTASAPTVTTIDPANGATDVPLNKTITKTIGMQETGQPLLSLILAGLMVLGGLILPRRIK
ncbi:MAG: Ig-like domain-containing protein [Methanobacterium sp.]